MRIACYLLLSLGIGAAGSDFLHAEESNSRESKKKLEELEETFILATKTPKTWLETAGSSTRISNNDFLGYGGADFADVVKYDPSVEAPLNMGSSDGTFGYGQSGYSSYNIRGMEGNRVLMMIDGVRQPDLYVSTSFAQNSDSEGGAGRDYYDPAMFGVTEILKGSASALYGSDAMGGAISFFTPEASDLIEGDNYYGGLLRGSYFTRNRSIAGQAFFALEKETYSLLLGYSGRKAHALENNGKGLPNPNNMESSSYLAKMTWQPNQQHFFKLTLENFERHNAVEVLAATGFSNIFDKEILNWESQSRRRASLLWRYTPSWGLDEIETHFYYQVAENEAINHSESIYGRIRDQRIVFDSEIMGVHTTAHKRLENHQFAFGGDLSLSESKNSFLRTDNGLPPYPNRITFAPADTTRASLFVQDQWKPFGSERWSLIGGLSVDYYAVHPKMSAMYLEHINRLNLGRNRIMPAQKHDIVSVSPRLDVIYKLNEQTRIYAQYAHGVRNPSAEEMSMLFDHPPSGITPTGSLTVPNPDLQEEKSDFFEMGIKQERDAYRWRVAAFYTHYTDFIENGVDTGLTNDEGRSILTTMNRGKVDIYGFELSGSYKLEDLSRHLDGLEVGLSTSRSWGIDRAENAWLNTIEPWKTIGWMSYTAPSEKWGIKCSLTYVDSVHHVSGSFFRPPSYKTLDLSAFWKMTEDLTLQVGVNNLFNQRYWLWGNTRRSGGHMVNSRVIDERYTAPGINGFLSLTYRF